MYDRILVPTDGSAGSNEALRHGIDLAQKYGATIHLVYVVDEGIYGHYGGIDAIEHAEEALEEAGEEALQTARERAESASVPVEVHVEHTNPHEGIIDTARQVGAGLVVMGTERRSEEYRRLLGSVSERVVRLSPIPVHLVKVRADSAAGISIREATATDGDEIQRIARRSMNTSYSAFLTETEIDEAIEQWYGTDTFEELLSDRNTIVLAAVTNGTVVGFSQSHLVDTPEGVVGKIHWLHVDPEYRGNGIGTSLLAQTRTVLEECGVDQVNGLVLSDYETGNVFYKEHGLEHVDSRLIEIGGESFEENVYSDVESTGRREPQVESYTTADGDTLYVNYEESEIGSDGSFFAAYTTRDLEQRYGWYCSNCESVDIAMDTMGRIVCNQCGNRHKPTRWDAVVTE